MDQQPVITELQQQLFAQLADNAPMPGQEDINSQLRELVKVAMNRVVLVVLDDIWSPGKKQFVT